MDIKRKLKRLSPWVGVACLYTVMAGIVISKCSDKSKDDEIRDEIHALRLDSVIQRNSLEYVEKMYRIICQDDVGLHHTDLVIGQDTITANDKFHFMLIRDNYMRRQKLIENKLQQAREKLKN